MKLPRNRKHLSDMINGCIENDSVEGLRFYLTIFRSNFFMPQDIDSLKKEYPNLLSDSISKYKVECANYLHSLGFTTNPYNVLLRECKIQKVQEVYNLLIELGYEMSDDIVDKISLRILEPYKIDVDKSRIDTALNLISSGFISEERFEIVLNKLIKDTTNKKFESNIKIFVRDFRLKKILNELDTNS